MTFNNFVKNVKEHEVSKIAYDLVRDWKDDTFKPEVSTKDQAIDYLHANSACDGALEALDDLWEAYEESKGNK